MKLDRKMTVAGFPIRKIREFFDTAFYEDCIRLQDLEGIAEESFWFGAKAKLVLDELANLAWIKSSVGVDKPEVCITTDGARVRIAKFIAPISRAKGEKILFEFLARVKIINENDALVYKVKEVRLFGSMLDPSILEVGDVDIAVLLIRRSPPDGLDWTDWNRNRGFSSGKNLSAIAAIFYGHEEVLKILKNKNSYISLHMQDDLELLNTENQLLFSSE